jgi:transposase
MDTNPTKQRQQFYRDYTSGQWSMSELCDRYQISRPTGYKWVDRIENEGLKAVRDRSRAPFGHPNRTPERVEREILALREKYGWGATKLRQIIERKHPTWRVPARSTVNELLERHGKLKKSRRKRLWKHSGAVRLETAGPNQIWPADFKGSIQNSRWEVLLPADRDGPLQPNALAVQRTLVGSHRRREACVSEPVSRVRDSGCNPDRQRRSIRLNGYSRPV